jgi:hypothetical protein
MAGSAVMLSIALYLFPYFDTKGSVRPDSLHAETAVLYVTSALRAVGMLALGLGVWVLRRSGEEESGVIHLRGNKGEFF